MTEDLPKGWEWATLDDLQANEPRAVTDGPFGSNLASRHYTDSGARVIRLQNIGEGQFFDDEAFISMEHYENLRAHEVREGDLVLASLGNDLPRVCMVPNLGVPAIVKADCIRFRPHPSLDPRWILYSLLAPQTKQYAAGRIRGVGRPRLGLGEIRRIPIPVPPLDEQRRIVSALDDHLSCLDAGAVQLDRIKLRVGRLSKSIRQFGILGGAFLGVPLPSGWRMGILNDVLEKIEAGKSFSCEARPAEEGEWGVIKVSAMTWGEFRPEENKAVPSGYTYDARYEIRSGDILVSRANTREYVGAPVLVRDCREQLLLSDKSLRLVPWPEVDRNWLISVLASPYVRDQISQKATGTKDSMRNISQKALGEVRIPIPPALAQADVAAALMQVLENLQKVDITIQEAKGRSEHLRHALLREAFTGCLVAQDLAEEPASVLLKRIRLERAEASKNKRGRNPKAAAAPVDGWRIDPDRARLAPVPNETQSELELGL